MKTVGKTVNKMIRTIGIVIKVACNLWSNKDAISSRLVGICSCLFSNKKVCLLDFKLMIYRYIKPATMNKAKIPNNRIKTELSGC